MPTIYLSSRQNFTLSIKLVGKLPHFLSSIRIYYYNIYLLRKTDNKYQKLSLHMTVNLNANIQKINTHPLMLQKKNKYLLIQKKISELENWINNNAW